MTATALMMLVDEGKVNVDDPVEKYLPEFKGQWVKAEQDADHVLLKRPAHPITVKNVLSHTSGLPFSSPLEEPTLDLLPLAARVRSYAMLPLEFEPDSKYAYSNAGINTAGRIIEVVSGMPYEQFMEQRLFQPLGMKDTTFWPSPRAGPAPREVLQTERGQDRSGRDDDYATPLPAYRPDPPADACRWPVFNRVGRRPVLPDDPQWRHAGRQALPLGGGRKANDQQANS